MIEINNSFDDLFAANGGNTADNINTASTPFDKEAWAERKQQERADVYALVDEGTEAIASSPEHFKAYLDVQARFDRYSVTNAILIAKQMPDATRLADFDTWKAANMNIKKGESSISIFEPGKEFTRDDGTTGINVNVKKVFDVSQTTAKPTPEAPKPDARTAIKALISVSPCPVKMDNERVGNRSCAYDPAEKVIFIKKGMDGNDILRVLTQEVAAAKFAEKGMDRRSCAFYTYCSSYVLGERFGFDTGKYDFDRVPEHLKGMEPKEIRSQLAAIRDMANSISQDMTRAIDNLEKSNKVRTGDAR